MLRKGSLTKKILPVENFAITGQKQTKNWKDWLRLS
jgi:hypothetical protein